MTVRPFMAPSSDPRAVKAQEYLRRELPHVSVSTIDRFEAGVVEFTVALMTTLTTAIPEIELAQEDPEYMRAQLDRMVVEFRNHVPKELGLPAVEATELWLSKLLSYNSMPSPLNDTFVYDQRDDGSAVVPADQLRALLKMAGYEFRNNMPRGG